MMQYALALYAVHFIIDLPHPNYKIRFINQQTGDCVDSSIINAKNSKNQPFPIHVKLKGAEKILAKLKIINVQGVTEEIVRGEGVATIHKDAIDSSVRVPLYDKTMGVEEVAVCIIQIFISGFTLQKHGSTLIDKSKEDWRERSEDAVYSQMSYTVQSQKGSIGQQSSRLGQKQVQEQSNRQPVIVQKQQNKQVDLQSPSLQNIEEIKVKQLTIQNNNSKITNRKSSRVQSNRQLAESRLSSNQTPLGNKIYLSIPASHKKSYTNQKNSFSSKEQSIKQEARPLLSRIYTQNDSKMKDQSQKQQNLISKLKQILQKIQEKHEQNQRPEKFIEVRSAEDYYPRHKIRRKQIKFKQMSDYKSQNRFIKYSIPPQSRSSKLFGNFKVMKFIDNELKQNSQHISTLNINKISLLSLEENATIVTFDAAGYYNYCISNGIQKQESIDLRVPDNMQSIQVKLSIQEEGNFIGLCGLQQGSQMMIVLKQIFNQKQVILQKQEFKLYFSIKHQFLFNHSPTIRQKELDVSFKQQESVHAGIEHRRHSHVQLSQLQPWNYLEVQTPPNLKLKQQALERDENLSKIYGSKKQMKDAGIQINEDKKFHHQKEIQQFSIKKTKKTQYHSSQKSRVNSSSLRLSIQRKSIDKISNQEKQQESQASMKKYDLNNSYNQSTPRKRQSVNQSRARNNFTPEQIKQIEQINRIRNGNRNNYKFQKQPKIKQMWEKLLIKNKTEQQKNQKQEVEKLSKELNKILINSRLNRSSMSNFSAEKYTKNKPKMNKKIRIQTEQAHNKLYMVQNSSPTTVLNYPLRSLYLEINNFSITQSLNTIQLQERTGRFIKFNIEGRNAYFTEVVFKVDCNSILWKLKGCSFSQLSSKQRLQISIFSTVDNRITLLGNTNIRINKLYFLRNNHIYNGNIENQGQINGQFTFGFKVEEINPFEIIQEQEEDTLMPTPLYHKTLQREDDDEFESLGDTLKKKM